MVMAVARPDSSLDEWSRQMLENQAVSLVPCLSSAGLAEEREHSKSHEASRFPAKHGEVGRFHERDMELWRDERTVATRGV